MNVDGRKTTIEQALTLNFKSVMENEKKKIAEVIDGEIEKLDNSVQRNTKKSAKYAGTISQRLP